MSRARTGTARRGKHSGRTGTAVGLAVMAVAAVVSIAGPFSRFAAGADDRTAKPEAPQAGSPRAVVVTFLQSFNDGNVKALRDVVLADGDDERKLAEGMTDVAKAVAAARKAVISKFNVGDQEVKVQIFPVDMFNGMTEKVEEDAATVMKDGESFMVLKKVNGTWRIPIGEVVKRSGKTNEQTMTDVRGAIERVGQVAKGVESGKYTNAEEAAKAIGEAVPSRD
jgi:predicted secreted protein